MKSWRNTCKPSTPESRRTRSGYGKAGNSDPNVRKHCASALGRIGPNAKAAVPQLTKTLQDEDLVLRRLAAEALWLIDGNADLVVPALAEILVEQSGRINEGEVQQAARLLSRIGPDASAAVPALVRLLKESEKLLNDRGDSLMASKRASLSKDIRMFAGTLGAIGPRASDAIPVLTELLNDSDQFVVKAAAASLARIQPNASVEPAPSQDSERQSSDTSNGDNL